MGGGVLLNPYTILTAAHNNIGSEFSYGIGKDFVSIFSQKQNVSDNIEYVIPHPNLDLAIVHLQRAQTSAEYGRIQDEPILVGAGPLTLSSVSSLHRQELYAGYVSEITQNDQYGTKRVPEGILICHNSSASPGDSGGPLYLENNDTIVGINIGAARASMFGLRPRSYFVNLTNPKISQWIKNNSKIG